MISEKHNKNKKITNSKQVSTTEAAKLFNTSLFGELFEADKNRLYAYIYAFVSNQAIADDVFQETCLTLWKEFDQFKPGTNFSHWANKIAFNRVLTFRNKQKKYLLGFDDEFFEEFSGTVELIESKAASQEKKWRYLEQCRALLSSPLQAVYQHFYVENATAQQIADNSGRSIHAIKKSVHKLRKQLFGCIDKKIEEASS